MSFGLPRIAICVSVMLASFFLSVASIAAPTSAEERACAKLRNSFEQGQLGTQLQLNIALFSAAGTDCTSLATKLLAVGASIEAANRFGTTALGQAARNGHLDMVDVLLARGAQINARNVGGATPLYIAAKSDRAAVEHRLLAKGADPNLARNNGLTPLIAAAYNGNPAIVADLLAHHANPNALDHTDKTAILYASAEGFTPVVRLLLKAGVDAKAAYGNHLTALMWAAGYADGAGLEDAQNVAKLLLDHGAQLDATDNRGRTALMIAAQTGHLEMVDFLIRHGANRSLRDKSGMSAADLAITAAIKRRLLAQ